MNFKRSLSAFVLLFLLIILSNPAEGEKRFGICGLRLGSQLTAGCQMAKDAGLGWYRCVVRWNEVVDDQGNFKLKPNGRLKLDRRLEAILGHGINVLVVLRSVHEKFAPDSGLIELPDGRQINQAAPPAREPEDHVTTYREFVRKFVERYDGDGQDDADYINSTNKIVCWGVETEPGKKPDKGSNWWKGTAGEYTDLYLAAYDEIKQACPDAKVFLSAFTADSMMYYMDNGISFPSEVLRILHENDGDFDVFNLHCYWDYTSYDEIHDAASTHLNLFPEFSSKPIWFTETNVDFQNLSFTEEEEQEYNAFVAKDIVKRFAIMFDRGVKKIFWFQLRDMEETFTEDLLRFAGLAKRDLTPKPVYYTYKLFTEKLSGRTSSERIGSDPGGWIFKFGQDYNSVYVMWSDSSPEEATQVSISVPWEEARITHAITQPHVTEPYVETRQVVGGSLQIDLDDSPVFIVPAETSCGDVNGDGECTPQDAVDCYWLSFEASWTPAELNGCDCNGDGQISAQDAVSLFWKCTQ